MPTPPPTEVLKPHTEQTEHEPGQKVERPAGLDAVLDGIRTGKKGLVDGLESIARAYLEAAGGEVAPDQKAELVESIQTVEGALERLNALLDAAGDTDMKTRVSETVSAELHKNEQAAQANMLAQQEESEQAASAMGHWGNAEPVAVAGGELKWAEAPAAEEDGAAEEPVDAAAVEAESDSTGDDEDYTGDTGTTKVVEEAAATGEVETKDPHAERNTASNAILAKLNEPNVSSTVNQALFMEARRLIQEHHNEELAVRYDSKGNLVLGIPEHTGSGLRRRLMTIRDEADHATLEWMHTTLTLETLHLRKPENTIIEQDNDADEETGPQAV